MADIAMNGFGGAGEQGQAAAEQPARAPCFNADARLSSYVSLLRARIVIAVLAATTRQAKQLSCSLPLQPAGACERCACGVRQ